MASVEYYTRPGKRQPVAEWRHGLDVSSRSVIDAKMRKLSEYGLALLPTQMLTVISGDESDFYELRGGQCRIAVYYDRPIDTFVLLCGWLKKRRAQKRDVEQARSLLHEYLSMKGG